MKRIARAWRALSAALVAAQLGVAQPAGASGVALVAPSPGDPFIEEVFHRVGGELRLQHIDFEQLEGEPEKACPQASRPTDGPIACIVIAWRGDASVVRIWVMRPAAEPKLLEAVALERSAEAPTLLATRTVDLLKSALAFESTPAAATVRASTSRSPKLPHPSAPTLPTFALGAGVAELGAGSRFGASWGPLVEFSSRFATRFQLRVRLAAPLLGASASNSDASARLLHALGLVNADIRLVTLGPCALELSAGFGVHYLQARGEVAPGVDSLVAKRDDHVNPLALAGLGASAALGPHLALALDAQGMLLWPTPRVVVGSEAIPLGMPWLLLASSLRWRW